MDAAELIYNRFERFEINDGYVINWDAQELAKLVKPGVTVDFIE